MYRLTPGETVYYESKPYIIESLASLDELICKDSKGKIRILDPKDLDETKNENANVIVPSEHIDTKLYEAASKRLEIIKPLLKKRSRKEMEEAAKENGFSIQTLYNWINAYIESGESILALVPRYGQRGGKGKPRISEEQKKVIDEIIASRYLSPQKPNAAQIAREINALLRESGLEPVSYSTVNRIVKGLDERESYRKREGRSAYLNALKPSPGSLEATRPLEIVQIDHTPLDIQIVDERYRKPIGRPYITVALDVYSRTIYGFFVSLDAPGLYSVGQTLHMGLLPKEGYLENLGVEGEWKIFGVPETIHVDNAKEFRSRGLKTFCEIFGINLEFRPKGLPFFGGHVERVIRTINTQVHALSGTTFSNPKERGEYKSEGKAVFTLKELERYIADWIVNVYHKSPHKGLDGMTPEEKFEEGLKGKNGLPVPLRILGGREEKKFARIALLPFEERKITKQGVALFKLRFYDESLTPLIKPGKSEKHIFRYDPKDLNQIYFFHPDLKEFIEIPSVKRLYPPPTKWELEAVTQEMKRGMRRREVHNEAVYEAISRLRKMEEEASAKTKQARRKSESRRTVSLLAKKGEPEKPKRPSKTKPKIKKFEIDFEDN